MRRRNLAIIFLIAVLIAAILVRSNAVGAYTNGHSDVDILKAVTIEKGLTSV